MEWKIERLWPHSCNNVQLRMNLRTNDLKIGSGGERMANDVHIGSNIAILCEDSIDKEFWLLLVDKEFYSLDTSVVDGWS